MKALKKDADERLETMAEETSQQESLIRNVSDTARWAAMARAVETQRPDTLFRDPYARKLAGQRGEQILRQMAGTPDWTWALRTHLFDRAILAAVEEGFDTVLNLAAGLDTRPYRMKLPQSLRWIEVDLPAILEEKAGVLRADQPACVLERVPLDLANVAERRQLFARVGSSAGRVLTLTEGLLTYLESEEVASLARDLAGPATLRRWVLDIGSPGLIKLLQRTIGSHLEQAKAPFKFGPAEGPHFFEPAGWKVGEVHSLLKSAARARRLNLKFRLLALLPESPGQQGKRPWAGVCVLDR